MFEFFFLTKKREKKTNRNEIKRKEKKDGRIKLFVFVQKIVFCYSLLSTHISISFTPKIAFEMKCGGWRTAISSSIRSEEWVNAGSKRMKERERGRDRRRKKKEQKSKYQRNVENATNTCFT